MAKLKAVLDSLDDVPEALRDVYVEIDGKYRLDAEGVDSVGDVSGLKSALERTRRELRQLKDKIPEGFDPEDYQELLKLRDKQHEGSLTDAQKEHLDSLKKQMSDAHKKELGQRDDRIGKLTQALEKHLIGGKAIAALHSAKGSVDLLQPHVERHMKVIEEDGEFVTVIVDERGNERYGNGGTRLTPEEFVAELKTNEKYARAFDGSGSSGGGASRSAAGGGGLRQVVGTNTPDFLDNLADIADGKMAVAE